MFVVTLPKSAAKNPAGYAKRAKKEGADILEIRSDLTPRIGAFNSVLPLLVSIRDKNVGLIEKLQPEYIDIEDIHQKLPENDAKIILSFHNYKKTVSLHEVKKIAQKMCSKKPWMIKIATMVNDYEDLKVLTELQEFLRSMKIRATILGMGPKASLIRVLSPYKNFWTYACLDKKETSAPGQFPMSFYRLTSGKKNPKVFGILGGPQVSESLSPVIQNVLFHHHNVNAIYTAFPAEDFAKSWKTLTELGVSGFSVTAPFKKEVLSHITHIDPLVAEISSSNTVLKTKDGWIGCNTDVTGIMEGYPFLKECREVAVIGSGGVVPAVLSAISTLNPETFITVFARSTENVLPLTRRFDIDIAPLKALEKGVFDALVCCISEDVPLTLPKALTGAVAIDLRYGKNTEFLKAAKRKKYQTLNGLPMLVCQALKQFELFTGKKPTATDAKSLLLLLSSSS